jgi:hypothetical protein
MPLILDVLTHIDERSAAAEARQLERQFEEGGHAAGTSFGANLATGLIGGFHDADFDSMLGRSGRCTKTGARWRRRRR